MGTPANQLHKQHFKISRTITIILVSCLLTLLMTIAVMRWLFPVRFAPVVLSETESDRLATKLERLGRSNASVSEQGSGRPNLTTKALINGAPTKASIATAPAQSEPDATEQQTTELDGKPEPYDESLLSRNVRLTERELNGLIARDQSLAQRLVVDLSPDLASAKVLLPIPADFPVWGGRVLRIHAGLELRIGPDARPVIRLQGVSLMGVPLPNAWLGELKNVDLIDRYGHGGFWHSFAAGIEALQVEEGAIQFKLKP